MSRANRILNEINGPDDDEIPMYSKQGAFNSLEDEEDSEEGYYTEDDVALGDDNAEFQVGIYNHQTGLAANLAIAKAIAEQLGIDPGLVDAEDEECGIYIMPITYDMKKEIMEDGVCELQVGRYMVTVEMP